MEFEAPEEYLGDLSKLIGNKRGQLIDVRQENMLVIMKAKLPVAEMIGLSNDLRSCTEGRGTQFVVDQSFEKVPEELQDKISSNIRSRKGLKVDAETGVAVQA